MSLVVTEVFAIGLSNKCAASTIKNPMTGRYWFDCQETRSSIRVYLARSQRNSAYDDAGNFAGIEVSKRGRPHWVLADLHNCLPDDLDMQANFVSKQQFYQMRHFAYWFDWQNGSVGLLLEAIL
jgi:hypothetical protein